MPNLETQTKEFSIVINCPKAIKVNDFKNVTIPLGFSILNAQGMTYAYAFHDKDTNDDGELKTFHLHLVLSSPKRMRLGTCLSKIVGCFGLPPDCVSVDTIVDFASAIQYLTHKNDSSKYQYDYDCIVTNMDQSLLWEYYNRRKHEKVTASYLWQLIVIENRDDIELMFLLSLPVYNQYINCIRKMREVSSYKNEEYYNRIECLRKEVSDNA